MTEQRTCLMAVTGIFTTVGGIASVNRLVIRSFIENNYRVDVFALDETEMDLPDYAVDKVRYHVFAGNKIAFALALWRAQLAHRYSRVYCDHVNLAAALSPTSVVLRRPYVVWVHGLEIFPPNPTLEGKIGLTLADKRLTSSEYTRDIVLKRSSAKFPNVQAEVCELALDPVTHKDLSQSELSSLEIQPPMLHALDGQRHLLGPQLILHVGRITGDERDKGQKALLKAFPQVHQQYPDAQLALIGDGDGREEIIDMARMLPQSVHTRIFIPGHIDDQLLDRLYHTCYLFAMPSIGEGFGLVYIEAMSRNKPCLGARSAATPYIVRNGETGLLVDDPQSGDEVASKIEWLLAHPDEAARMGSTGYDLVRDRYQFPAFKERFFKILGD